MPYKPLAKQAAIARNGFTSEPTTRVSSRVAFLLPGNARKATVRLSTAQVKVVGAQAPSTNRLYELMVGASIGKIKGRQCNWPAK